MSVLGLTDEDAESAIFQALGAASVCWSDPPTGVFDSTRAKEIGDELVAHLRMLRLLPLEVAGELDVKPITVVGVPGQMHLELEEE